MCLVLRCLGRSADEGALDDEAAGMAVSDPSSKPRPSASALTSFSIDIEPQIMMRSVSGFSAVDAEIGELSRPFSISRGDAAHARRISRVVEL